MTGSKVSLWSSACELLLGCRASVSAAALMLAAATGPLSAGEYTTSTLNWWERPYLTGDGTGLRAELEENGFTIRSRLTQFVQGMPRGDGNNSFEYGGKIGFQVRTDLAKLGWWGGLSHTVEAEYNFGTNVNGRGGTLVPVNTALAFPGIDGADRFDITNFYFTQTFGDSGVILFGKINMFDVAAGKRHAGGAGIDSFWNTTFAAPPSGLVPPYLFGLLLSYTTPSATYGLWIYDPLDCVQRHCLESPFSEGLTIRGSVEFPVSIAGLEGHQGFVALFSTYKGTDLDSLENLTSPILDLTQIPTKGERFYFAYTFDQYLFRSPMNPDEGVGLFGQFGISEGNPTRLFWSAHIGLGGTGMVPGRSNDRWGIAYYYDALNDSLKDFVSPIATLRDEQGVEAYYDYVAAPWLTLGADLQIIRPGARESTAVFVGFRSVIEL